MIRVLYTLKSMYQGKKIYIWDVNRDSIGVFTKAVFREINIDGFVTPQEEFAGETFMNCPVLSLGQLEQNEEFIIIVSDNVDKDRIASVKTKVAYWPDVLALNEELKSKKLIVYGIGAGAKSLCRELREDNIIPDLFCVTKLDSNSQQGEKRVMEASELSTYTEYVVVISVKKTQYIWEILETLSVFQGLIYLDTGDLVCDMDLLHMNFMQSIAYAIKKNKSIYLYSQRNAVSDFLEDALNRYGVKISGYVYDQEDQSKDIQSIYTLALKGTEGKIIIVNENNPLQIIKARENVELAGFSLEDRNYISLQWKIRFNDEMLCGKLKEYRDPLLGGSILYSEGYPGWKVYGKEENRIKMIVLGGSTSSEVYHPENWICKLYDKLDSNGVKITIYNGAHAGNDIVSEILRLLRDGFVLKPDLVISMSGYNNLYFKAATNQFNVERLLRSIKAENICSGIYNDESLYFFWYRNEKLLKLISEFYGAKFFGFLEPMNCAMDYDNIWEKSLYETENRIMGSRDFAKFATHSKGEYTNLMNLFEHRDEMYVDMCHYTNRGHELIADEVYKIIEPTVKELVKQKHGEELYRE